MNAKNISNDFDHKRSYQIRGEFKKQMLQDLEHKTAQAARMKVVNELIPENTKLNNQFNPLVGNLNAYRIAKHRANEKKADPVDVLLEWKDSKYRDVIFAVGHSPFFVFYRTALQLSWYIVESKKGPICISLDATGSVIIPPSRSQRREGSAELKHVFFYTIMAKTSGGKSVPIAQMISQDQSSEFIALFLQKIFKNVRRPVEITCDESKALLKALAQTFNGYERIENYVTACMSAHLNGTKPPPCYIRIDRSHFVKNLTRKIKYRNFHKQNIIRNIFGYLIQCDSFATARKVILDFFTLILNENDGADECAKPLPSEDAKKRLLALCNTFDESMDYASDSGELENLENEETFMDLNFTTGWIDDILNSVVVKKSQNYHESAYFCNEKEKELFVKLFSSIALWSNIMNPKFGSENKVATSSDVESYFKSLKVGILERKRYRADDFVRINIEFANSEIKLNAMSHNVQMSPKIRKRSNSFEARSPNSPGKLFLIYTLV